MCETNDFAGFILYDGDSALLLDVSNKAESREASVVVAGSWSLVVLRAAELGLLRCEGLCYGPGPHVGNTRAYTRPLASGYASVDRCEVARFRGRYTCTAALMYRLPRCSPCTRPVENYARDKR